MSGGAGRRVRAPGAIAAAAAAAALVACAGCQPPDEWALFDPGAQLTGADLAPQDLRSVLVIAGETAEEHGAPSPTEPPPESIFPEGVPVELTVEQAALLSLRNNRDLRVRELNPAITATFEQIERGAFDPTLFANGEFFSEDAIEVSRATEERFGVTGQSSDVVAGVIQSLPSGTEIELSVRAFGETSNRSPEQHEARLGLTVTQSLLQGFGPAVNLASIRQARLGTVASLYELQGFVEALLADTEGTYWRFAFAAKRIGIFEQSLQVAQRQQEEVEQRIEIGVLAETEAATARAEVAEREQDLINAHSDLEVLRLRLLRLVNLRAASPLTLDVVAATDPATAPAPIDDLEQRIELAQRQRPDLNEARVRLEERRIETVVTRNGLLPQLDLFIALGKTGYSDAFGGAVDEMSGPNYDLTAGLAFSYPLGNRAAEGRNQAALLSRRAAAEAVSNLEQLVELDVRVAAAEVERARQQIAASAVTRALREEALRAENERFRVGQSTSLLVAQAQRDLLESQISEVASVVAYRQALILLYLSEGTLLSRRGLTLEPPPAQR